MSRDLAMNAVLSTQRPLGAAIEEVCAHAKGELRGAPDTAVVFVAGHDPGELDDLGARIIDRTGAATLIGCTAESVIGGAREIEEGPALVLWLAAFPHARLAGFHLEYAETLEGGAFIGWPDDASALAGPGSALVLLGDPFSFPVDQLLGRWNDDHPGAPVMGGMASAGRGPGENRLFLNRMAHDSGAVALAIEGAGAIRSVVSQGCRPIGPSFVITKSRRNVIEELGGRPALDQLRQLFARLEPAEQALLQGGLHLGRVINERKERFERGDFLVRHVLGVDPASGAIGVGDLVRTGQTVQFHVRDARTADEDLRELLGGQQSAGVFQPKGALLFSCNGRGRRMFDVPDHDARSVRAAFGDIPVAGFFAMGEIGPIGGANFLHSFTASLLLFA